MQELAMASDACQPLRGTPPQDPCSASPAFHVATVLEELQRPWLLPPRAQQQHFLQHDFCCRNTGEEVLDAVIFETRFLLQKYIEAFLFATIIVLQECIDATEDVVAIFATWILLQESREEAGRRCSCKFYNNGLGAGIQQRKQGLHAPARRRQLFFCGGWGRRSVGRSSVEDGGHGSLFLKRAVVVRIKEGSTGARWLHRTAISAPIQRLSNRRIIITRTPTDA